VARPAGPALAGVSQSLAFGLPFFLAGAIKSAYDVVLWRWFRAVPLPEEPASSARPQGAHVADAEEGSGWRRGAGRPESRGRGGGGGRGGGARAAGVRGRAGGAEAAGFAGLAVVASQNLAGDPWVGLALAARESARIRLGTAVTNPVTRHPAVTAAAAVTLQVASAGRFVHGIGRGDSALAHPGRAPASGQTVRPHLTGPQGVL